MKRRYAGGLALVLLLCMLAAVAAGCEQQAPTSSSLTATSSPSATSLASATTGDAPSTTATASGRQMLDRALAWIEAAPTQVTFGNYSVTYASSTKTAELTVVPVSSGEPLFSGTWWWSGDTDYYFQESPEGLPAHVTPEMALSMRQATYLGADAGMQYLAMLRFLFDPHRLLELSTIADGAEQPDGSWKIEAEVSPRDIVGLGLSDTDLARYFGTITSIRSTIEIAPDGSIRSLTTEYQGEADQAVTSYAFARAAVEPVLPGAWAELNEVTLQKARDEGWRPDLADAALDFDFPLYSVGDSYEGYVIRTIHVEPGVDLLFEYRPPRQPSGGSTGGADGYLLFEYSASDVPESESTFVENKTLIETGGQGEESYSVYKTAQGLPGRSILVKKGDTYISVSRIGRGASDVTEQLLAVAAALKAVAR